MTVGETDSRIRKLTKRKQETGELYTRRRDAEGQIGEVLRLGTQEIAARLEIRTRDAENYLLDETIVYLLRDAEIANDFRDDLYIELNRRIWKLLKKFRNNFKNQADFEDFGQKIEMAVLRKIFDYDTNLADYAEVNFGDFVVKTAKVAWRGELVKIRKEQDLFETPRADDEENSADPLENTLKTNEAAADYTLMLREGLDKLPPHIMTVAELMLDGWQIESKNADELTISKKLKVSSRTIRYWLKEARSILADYNAEVKK